MRTPGVTKYRILERKIPAQKVTINKEHFGRDTGQWMDLMLACRHSHEVNKDPQMSESETVMTGGPIVTAQDVQHEMDRIVKSEEPRRTSIRGLSALPAIHVLHSLPTHTIH